MQERFIKSLYKAKKEKTKQKLYIQTTVKSHFRHFVTSSKKLKTKLRPLEPGKGQPPNTVQKVPIVPTNMYSTYQYVTTKQQSRYRSRHDLQDGIWSAKPR